MLIAAGAHAGDDYFLINGGAEDGNLTGWGTTPSDAPIAAVTHFDGPAGTVNPQAGDYFFSFAQGPQSGTISLYQGAPLPASSSALTFSGWIQTAEGDHGEVVLRALDADGNPVAEHSTGTLTSSPLEWKQFGLGFPVPPDAAHWEVELRGTLADGTVIDVFYDSTFLSIGLDADLDRDGDVDEADLGELLAAWGRCGPAEPCDADLNRDGFVDGADLGLFLTAWN